MQFIQHGRISINVNRIVRIDAEEKQYRVIWMNELNTPETVRVRKDDSEALQYSCRNNTQLSHAVFQSLH